jgi:choline dehydrogenase
VKYRDAVGRLCVAAAWREVALCVGVVGSPHVLLLSGVGPLAELRAARVAPMVASHAVGKVTRTSHSEADVEVYEIYYSRRG